MDPKRLTLALVLCVVFLVGYSMLVQRLRPPAEPGTSDPGRERTPSEGSATPQGQESGSTAETQSPSTAPSGDETAESSPQRLRDVGEKTVVTRVETDRFIVFLTTRGAVPARVLLKGITTDTGLDPNIEDNLLPIIETYEEGQPPLAVVSPDDPEDLLGMDWVYQGETRDGEERVHTFVIAPGNGVRYVKRFRVADGSSDIGLDVELQTLDADVAGIGQTLRVTGAAGIVYEGDPASNTDETFGIASQPGRDPYVEKLSALQKQEFRAIAMVPAWVAVVSKYFAAVLEPLDSPNPAQEVVFHSVVWPQLAVALQADRGLTADVARKRARIKIAAGIGYFDKLAPQGQALEYRFRMYLGLKDHASLSSPQYSKYLPLLAVDSAPLCGLGFIVKPIASLLFLVLKGIHAVLGNYGFAIIVLTFIVKLCVFPVTRHQQISMASYQAKMQKHKPELDRIREKYKNNRQRQQQETLKLFKEKGISPFPLGGCLPMFATIPIFFGLFYLLRTAPELRQSPFILWIDDLSRPDHLIPDWPRVDLFCIKIHGLNLLPLLMTVAWFFQQRSMPKPQDPQQAQTQQMMMFMPILFGFMLYNYAAGLSLYWLTNALLGMVEQRIIRRAIPRPQPVPSVAKG